MDFDIRRIWNHTGKLKIVVIVVGMVDVGLTSHSYFIQYEEEEEDKECFIFLAITLFGLSMSFFMILLSVVGLLSRKESRRERICDVAYHGLMSILIFSGAVLVAYNLDRQRRFMADNLEFLYHAKLKYYQRICACSLGFLNTLFYLCISLEMYGQLRQDQRGIRTEFLNVFYE